ncbi:MAG TPA: TetR/AcrR family transcriptional regulator [Virgibacillus sp.]|nr:TetR/AcrR family transcriptional regulator [Virgibacillus sp.]
MSKKMELLKAASRVVIADGVYRLTLEAVADEAGVSKGGLLYHYSTKDELIKAMNIYVIKQFREFMDNEMVMGCSYHQAYLRAISKSLRDDHYLNVSTSMLAAISNNQNILALWREEYQIIKENLFKEDVREEYTLLILTTCDGIWFSRLFDLTHIDTKEEQRLITYLLDLLEDD